MKPRSRDLFPRRLDPWVISPAGTVTTVSTRPHLDVGERRRRLGVRHRLAGAHRTDDVVELTDSVVALHSSDPTTVYLSAAARQITPTIEATEKALYDDISLVRHHAMRRTIWVMTLPTAADAHRGATLKVADRERRRLEQAAADSGYDDVETWVSDMADATLAALADGPVTAREIGQRRPELTAPLVLNPGTKYPTTQPAHTRLLQLLGFEGRAVRTRPAAGWTTSQYRWAVADDWSPGLFDRRSAADVADAQAALADRWLQAFGPAPASDLQWWTGWTKTDTERALEASGATAVTVGSDAETPAWVAADDVELTPDPGHWVALVPGLDATVMGWKDRRWYLDPEFVATLFDRNGNAGSCVLVDGEVVGGWAQRADGHIAVRILRDVGREVAEEVADAAHALQDLLGDVRFRPRFPAPIQHDLTG